MPLFEGAPRSVHWRSSPGPINAGPGTSQGSFFVFPFDLAGDAFFGNLEANTVALAVSHNWTATVASQVFSSTMRIGLYTRSGSTLNLINSASVSWGATAANTGNSASFQGVRYITIHSSQWSSKPYLLHGQRYFGAFQFLTNVTSTAMSLMNAVSVQTSFSRTMYGAGAPNASHQPWGPFRGIFNATTTAVPATIQASQLTGSGAGGSVFPFFRVDADYNVY